VVAVDELLLREERELLVGNIVDTLSIAAHAESPAGAAVALVLDGSHSTVIDPVLARGPVAKLAASRRKEVALDRRGIEGTEILLGELLAGEISKLVKAEARTVGNVLVLLVETLDDLAVAKEVAEAKRLLGGTAIETVVGSLPFSPLLVDGNSSKRAHGTSVVCKTLHHFRKTCY